MNPVAALIEPEVIELLEAGRYGELREALHTVPAADVADILSGLSPEMAAIAFRFLPRDDAAECFAYLPPEFQEELIRRLGEAGALRIVEAMDPDDRVRLLDELPGEVAARLVASLPAEDRRVTQAILGYPARSVGRIMTPDYIRIRPDWTAARALEHVRKAGRDAETINVVYVVDDHGVLVDDLRLRQLIMAEPDAPIVGLLNRQFITLRADQPQEDAVLALQKYDRVALPVVDTRGALLGIVTHDDVADIAQQEATEDIQKLGGVEALEDPYMSTPLLSLVRKRGLVLSVLFVGEMLTASAMGTFEHQIERAVVLALFIPLIISSGGNSGSQASTLIIRAMALREIKMGDWWRVLRREIACGAMLGSILGVLGMVRVTIWGAMGWYDSQAQEHYHLLATTILFSVLGIVLWGCVVGAMLPFVLKRLRLDPATSSAPFVATLVDVTGIVIYFTCAMLILRTTLLASRPPDPVGRVTIGDSSYLIFENAEHKPDRLVSEQDPSLVIKVDPAERSKPVPATEPTPQPEPANPPNPPNPPNAPTP